MNSWILCDIDGTIADTEHREYLHPPCGSSQADYKRFLDKCDMDEPIHGVIRLMETLSLYHQIAFVTARGISHWDMTVDWLTKHLPFPNWTLHMRLSGDARHDWQVKFTMYYNQFKNAGRHVEIVIDDRKQCVEMWRQLGLICLQPRNTP